MNWLISAGTRAGVKGIDTLNPRVSATPAELWESVARTAGLSPEELASAVASGLRLRIADVDALDRRAIRLVPERVARRFNVLPLRDDDRTIYVATADPTNVEAEQQIEFASGRRVQYEIATPDAVTRGINAAYSANLVVDAVLAAVDRDARDSVKILEEEPAATVPALDVDSEPIVKLTSVMLRDAIIGDASDIHIEPGAMGGTVRFRIDGLMRVHLQLPTAVITRIVSRIKVMSKLNIADRFRPQDGRARIQVDGRAFDLRVSTVPTRDAEKAVIRILRPMKDTSLDGMRIPKRDVDTIRALLGHRDGIVAITGPTGSGKTTTIYSAIREIAAKDVNVVTVEDPVEFDVPGLTQIQVDSKRGVTFASALKSILRQDPDVIFVGEIRDLETATIAVQAAMTGHLVIATVHANDAVGSISRLRDLGVDSASLAASLRGSVAQRLVRKLCDECSVSVGGELTAEEQRLATQYGIRPVKRAVGCPACSNTGYRGRLPVVEIADFSGRIAEEIGAGTSVSVIQRAAVNAGMRALHEAGLERVLDGDTTLQEVERVIGTAEADTEQVKREPVAVADQSKPAGATVLVVEDEPVQRRLARGVLEKAGYTIIEAQNGREALKHLHEAPNIALVVTDLQMEGMGGAELVRAIRGEMGDLPVIVLTGSAGEASELELLDAGADDYLRKPIDAPRLVARVRASLRRRSDGTT